MKKLFLLLLLIASSAVFAQPVRCSNFYAQGFGGFNFINDVKEKDACLKMNMGYAVGGSLGCRVSKIFRIEGEGAFRCNTFDKITAEKAELNVDGDIKKATAMANGILEYPFFERTIIPYVGFGMGGHWDWHDFKLEEFAVFDGNTCTIYDFERVKAHFSGFAYQAIVGFNLYTGPRGSTALEYRYFDGPNIQGNHTVDLSIKTYF